MFNSIDTMLCPIPKGGTYNPTDGTITITSIKTVVFNFKPIKIDHILLNYNNINYYPKKIRIDEDGKISQNQTDTHHFNNATIWRERFDGNF